MDIQLRRALFTQLRPERFPKVEGVIRRIAARKNQTILTINRAQYVLSPELAVQLGPVL